jgi:hypothetical protein
LGNNTSGDHNVALGNLAGFVGPTNFFCTFIGESAYASNSLARDYATTLGADSRSTNGGQVRIGSTAVGSIGGPQSWTTVSDARFKNGVREDVPGLPFILGLRPVTYHLAAHELAGFLNEDLRLDTRTGTMMTHTPPKAAALRELVASKRQTGFLAQEVEAHAKQLGYAFSGVDAAKNDGDLYGLRYAEFVVPLVKAVQEQQEQIEEQRQRIERLEVQLKQVLDGR